MEQFQSLTPVSTRPRGIQINLESNGRRSVTPSVRQPTLRTPSMSRASDMYQGQLETEHLAEDQNDQCLKGVENRDEFQLYHALLKTPIIVEFGEKLEGKCTIHKELLCCYSLPMRRLFQKAEGLHQKYTVASALRKQVKALIWPQTPQQAFIEKELESKAIPLIEKCFKSYPLLEYQTQIKDFLEEYLEVLFKANKIKGPPSNGDLKKKENQKPDIRARLQVFSSEAIVSIVRHLFKKLREIKRLEISNATRNDLKAAAQQRIILPGSDEKTVGSLLSWLYENRLHFDSAEHLYMLHGLAEKLGIRELAGACMSKLSSAAITAIQDAYAHGTTLKDFLLNEQQYPGSEDTSRLDKSLHNVVQVVFKYVLQDDNPPMVLQRFVVNAIANSADIELYKWLEGTINRHMSHQLCEALILRVAKTNLPSTERSSPTSVKTEVQDNTYDKASTVLSDECRLPTIDLGHSFLPHV